MINVHQHTAASIVVVFISKERQLLDNLLSDEAYIFVVEQCPGWPIALNQVSCSVLQIGTRVYFWRPKANLGMAGGNYAYRSDAHLRPETGDRPTDSSTSPPDFYWPHGMIRN
jgi:hypothetical protein